jgi:hypothetical protein
MRREHSVTDGEMSSEIRGHVEAAHDHVRIAQDLAYDSRPAEGMNRHLAPRRVRFALGRAQQALIKLLVR